MARSTLERTALDCSKTLQDLQSILLALSDHIVECLQTAGMVELPVFNGYSVEADPGSGRHLLTKRDSHGVVLFRVSDQTNLQYMVELSEDVLNGLVPGIAQQVAERLARGNKLYQEMSSAGAIATLVAELTAPDSQSQE